MARGAAVAMLASALCACAALPPPQADCAVGAPRQRHALYFGLTTADGAEIDDAQWRGFLSDIVTPRIPEGLTVLHAYGQWRDRAGGAITRQPARTLVIVTDGTDAVEARIEAIRAAYRERFDQQSVLRVSAPVCAAF